jgi:multiple sugar transport system substrate-binding protein
MAQHRRPVAGDRTISRRRLVQVSALAAGAAGVAGPGRAMARQASTLSGKVTMWAFPLSSSSEQGADEAMWADLTAAFTAENPDVEVSVEVLPWANRNDKISTALTANANPDVVYLNDDFIPQYAGDGALEPVDDLLADDADDFFENARLDLSLNGALYAVPILREVAGTVYNTAAFTQAGVTTFPATWDEILAAGPAFRDAGLFVTSYYGSLESSLNESFYPLLWQAGGEVLNADNTQAAFNSAEGLDALTFVDTLFSEGFVNEDEGVTLPPAGGGSVLEGKVGLLLTAHPSEAAQCAAAWGADALKIGPPLTRAVQTSYASTAGWAVFANSKNKDAAKAWAKFLGSPDPMTTILKSGGYMPPRQSLQGMYKDDPLLSQFEPYAPLMRGGVHHREARQIISTMLPYIQAAFLGEQSAEDALAAAESDVNRLLERG